MYSLTASAELEMIDFMAKKEHFKKTMKFLKDSEVSISISDRQIESKEY